MKRFIMLAMFMVSVMCVFSQNTHFFVPENNGNFSCYFAGEYVGESVSKDLPIVRQNFGYLNVFICEKSALEVLKKISVDGKGFSLYTLSVKLPWGEIGYDFNPNDRNISIRMRGSNVMIVSGRDAIVLDGVTGYPR